MSSYKHKHKHKDIYTMEDIIRSLKSVYKRANEGFLNTSLYTQYRKPNEPTRSTLHVRFGTNSFSTILNRVGIPHNRKYKSGATIATKKDIIRDIKAFYKMNGAVQARTYVHRSGATYSVGTVRVLFGTWNKALLAAGINVNQVGAYNKEFILEQIKNVYKDRGFISYEFFADRDGLMHPTTIARYFGSFRKACIEASIPEIRLDSIRRRFKVKANDGHVCDSYPESIVDNWLHSHNIKHDIHVRYPKHRTYNSNRGGNMRTCDFKCGSIWVEYAGYIHCSRYILRMKEKKHMANDLGLKLVIVYPNDIKDIGKKLGFLLNIE